mgnify:CR=1 FL=1
MWSSALCWPPFSYGAVQVRVAEALCLLPVFGAEYIVGVTLGCFLANLLGSTVVDVVFGTLATLLACLVTYKLRDIRVKGLAIPASLPPVVFNMIIVGAFEITFLFLGRRTHGDAGGVQCRYCRHWRAHQLHDSGCGARQADRKQRGSEQNFLQKNNEVTSMCPELILWDWNGTLLDDVDLCVDALNRLLAGFGYPAAV